MPEDFSISRIQCHFSSKTFSNPKEIVEVFKNTADEKLTLVMGMKKCLDGVWKKVSKNEA